MGRKKTPRHTDLVKVFYEDWLNLTRSRCAENHNKSVSVCARHCFPPFSFIKARRVVLTVGTSLPPGRHPVTCPQLIFLLGCRQPDSCVGSVRSATPPTLSRSPSSPCPNMVAGSTRFSHFLWINPQSIVYHIMTVVQFRDLDFFSEYISANWFKCIFSFSGEMLKKN